jgi:hypothetical protein
MNELYETDVVALDAAELCAIEGGGWMYDVGWCAGYAVRCAALYYQGEFDALSAP